MKYAICYICHIPDQNNYHYSVVDYSCNTCSLKEIIKYCNRSVRNLKSRITSAKIKLKSIGNK